MIFEILTLSLVGILVAAAYMRGSRWSRLQSDSSYKLHLKRPITFDKDSIGHRGNRDKLVYQDNHYNLG